MTSVHHPSTSPALTWTVVDDGVWVANHHGEFAGMAERTAASDFRLTDQVSRELGRYRSLAAAQSALGRPKMPGGSARPPRRRRFELVSLFGGSPARVSVAAQHKEKTV